MWSHSEIEREARQLLSKMEGHAKFLWPNTPPSRIQMCDPEAACELLGLRYLPDQFLGSYGGTSTAGMMDRKNKAVLLSYKQTFEALRFTAAHEVGHYVLHSEQMLFRDRTLSEPGGPGRPPVELEADYFAACFLAPPKLLRLAFLARFESPVPLINTGAVCFNLDQRSAQRLESLPPKSREFSRAVALAKRYNGKHFESLARLFNVSPGTMAIRLEELELVA